MQSMGSFGGSMIGGGVLLLLFKQLGWNSLLPCVALFVIVALLPLLFNNGIDIAPKDTHERAKKADVFYFFTQKNIWKQIGFLFLYYSGLIGTLAMLKPYLVDLGYSMKEIGVMSGVVGTSFGFVFSFIGGFIVRRIGRHCARILFSLFVLLATLYFLGLSYTTPTLEHVVCRYSPALGKLRHGYHCGYILPRWIAYAPDGKEPILRYRL